MKYAVSRITPILAISWLLTFTVAILIFILSSCDVHDLDEPGALVPKTVDEDPALPSIFVNNTQLHAESFGDPQNPMIVVIHGGPGSDYRSLLNCSAFTNDSFFVVFYDQRGSGLSRRHDADIYTIQLYIDDLDSVIDHYRHDADQKVILIGHSWGAMLATAYVNEYPDRADGLVLIEPGGFTWKDTKDYINRFRTLEFFGECSNDFVYLDQFLTGHDHITLDYKATLSMSADFAKGNKVGNAGPYPYWRPGAICNSASFEYVDKHSFDFTTNLDQYTKKVLFVYSERNEAYGQTHAERVSSAYPNVQLVKINDTGHEVPYFGWNNFYPIAKNYLNEMK